MGGRDWRVKRTVEEGNGSERNDKVIVGLNVNGMKGNAKEKKNQEVRNKR